MSDIVEPSNIFLKDLYVCLSCNRDNTDGILVIDFILYIRIFTYTFHYWNSVGIVSQMYDYTHTQYLNRLYERRKSG